MGNITRRTLLRQLSLLVLCCMSRTANAESLACPFLQSGGVRFPLTPPPVDESSLRLSDFGDPSAAYIERALQMIGMYESGGAADPWITVSNQEHLSLGYLQWNYDERTLQSQLLTGVDLNSAPKEIRDGLIKIANGSNLDALKVISNWTAPSNSEPRIYGVRKSVVTDLQAFIGSPAMRVHQKKIMAPRLRRANQLACAWCRDALGSPVASVRAFTFFFDVVVFNGDLANLWVQHVKALKPELRTPLGATQYVAQWLDTCRDTRLYSLADGQKNAVYWQKVAEENKDQLDEEQIELLLLAMLRAQRSNLSNGTSLDGIYQVDVLNRHGTIAIGSGYCRNRLMKFDAT